MKKDDSKIKAIISILMTNEIVKSIKVHTRHQSYDRCEFSKKYPLSPTPRYTSTRINSLFLLEFRSYLQIHIFLYIIEYSRKISNNISQKVENTPKLLLTKKSIFPIIINWKRIDIWKLLLIDSIKKEQSKISTNCIPGLTMDFSKIYSKRCPKN